MALSSSSLEDRVVAASWGASLFQPISARTRTTSPVGLTYSASCLGSRSFFSRLFGPIACSQVFGSGVLSTASRSLRLCMLITDKKICSQVLRSQRHSH